MSKVSDVIIKSLRNEYKSYKTASSKHENICIPQCHLLRQLEAEVQAGER